MKRQLAFVVDATKCINCKTCEIACRDINDAGTAVRLRRVRAFESGEFPAVSVTNISMACNHCVEPLCAKHCPALAYEKRPDGIVIHHAERCIGCRYCLWMCPYGAPQFDDTVGIIRKCDLCARELDAGRQPACVEACPTRVIEVRWSDDPVLADSTIDIQYLPSSSITMPASRYRVKRSAHHE